MPSDVSLNSAFKTILPIPRTIQHPGWVERHITFPPGNAEGAHLNGQLETYCASSIEMVHLDWFGGPDDSREAARRLQTRDRQTAGTMVVGDDAFLSPWTQVRMISGISMTPVYDQGRLVGRFFEDADARYCMLGGIVPPDLSVSRGEQTAAVLSVIRRTLQKFGMDFRHVIRTWFYLDRILDWYGEFNSVRTLFFKEIELDIMPASTGVGAANNHGAALSAKVIAVMPKTAGVSVSKAVSPLQGEAVSYGSSFSRAIELCDASSRTLFISGTASISPDGRTLHTGDTVRQIETTMEVVDAMLDRCGMGITDTMRGVVYFRNACDATLWNSYCERRELLDLPVAVAQSDVCRDDLLFEIELDASKAK